MEIAVALDGSKRRDLSFYPGDDLVLNLKAYAKDGDSEPIEVINSKFIHGYVLGPELGAEFTVPEESGREPYKIVGDVSGQTTTLAFGWLMAGQGYPEVFCWSGRGWFGCDRWLDVWGTAAENIQVKDVDQYYMSQDVEGVLQEVGARAREHENEIDELQYLVSQEMATDAIAKEQLRRLALGEPSPGVQTTVAPSTLSRDVNDVTVIAPGLSANLYHHSPGIARAPDGRVHICYSKGLIHGFGGFGGAVDPQGRIVYRYSDQDCAPGTLSAEQVIALPLPPVTSELRTVFDCTIGVTPSGRIVVLVSDIPVPGTGQTKYRWFVSDGRGEPGTWVDKGVFLTAPDDYARIYSGGIKTLPLPGGGYRMAFSEYRKYQITPALYQVGMFYSDDNFESIYEGAPIQRGLNTNNETDFTFVDANIGIAISRNNMGLYITRNGPAGPWIYAGSQLDYPAIITTDFVAPVLNTVWANGHPFILCGYSERSGSVNRIRWLVASLFDVLKMPAMILAGTKYRPWGNVIQTGAAIDGSSGYCRTLMYDNGEMLYVDCNETGVSPTTGYVTAEARVTRVNATPWFPMIGGVLLGSSKSYFNRYQNNESTFTPTITAGTPGTITYAAQAGHCMVVGEEVILRFYMIATLSGTSGDLRLGGLPVIPSTNSSLGWRSSNLLMNMSPTASIAAGTQLWALVIGTNATEALLYRSTNTTAMETFKATHVLGQITIYGTIRYLTNAIQPQ